MCGDGMSRVIAVKRFRCGAFRRQDFFADSFFLSKNVFA